MSAWITQHVNAFNDAVRRLAAAPLNSALSLFVIGIALTLPGAGWLVIDNLQQAARSASGVQQISLFMALDADKKAVGEIESRLKQADPGKWRFVPREEALKRLQANEGMSEVIASLPRNPLPDAYVIEPRDTAPVAMEALAKEMQGWPKVSHVQLDSAWAKRFDTLIRLGRLVVTLLGAVFAVALVAVTFNTIRLQIFAHHAEIEVARLIGATDGWIRRPFTYFGALQGALGGLLTYLLVAAGALLIGNPLGQLIELYGASFAPAGPSAGLGLALVGAGSALGWFGALLSVHLSLQRA